MKWVPEFSMGWLNGWIPLVLLVLTDGVLFLVFPKKVMKRLWDRSGWTQQQVAFTVIGKLCALVSLLMLFFTPLNIGSSVFTVGIVVVILGLAGLVKALFDFKNTPLDQPVDQGIYTISRHPQIVMASVVLLGDCIAIGSWSAVMILLAARIFSHFSILAEEQVCLRQYGAAYQAYLNRVPRYFLYF